ncbi:MAG: hypothetical protein HPZ91_19485 [Lentisphaeria bacterium]|nr:hypothetical protein [Lentisphaeria bacterium]
MTNDEFRKLTKGLTASYLGNLLHCSEHAIGRYRRKTNSAAIPERVAILTLRLNEYMTALKEMRSPHIG